MSAIDFGSLDALFRPTSVAILGASSDPGKIGGRPVASMLKYGYSGRIIPVNPNAEEIQGLPAFASILDVDGPVDMAICALPERLVEDVVDQCIEVGVKSMVLFSAGFAEVSDEGAERQQRIAEKAKAGGMRILGPNSIGMVNKLDNVIATFSLALVQAPAGGGKISVVSQSGAFSNFCLFLLGQRGMGVNYVVATGNEADVGVAECLAYMANDPATEVILLYLEGCKNGDQLIEGLRLAREKKKPVIAIKVGSTDIGSAAAASHTGALAGSDQVIDAVLRQYGAHRAHSVEEFIDIACAVAIGGMPANDRVGLVTTSGGVGVLMADDASKRGLEVPEFPQSTQKKIKEMVPFAGVRNPLDVTAQLVNDLDLFKEAMNLVLTEADCGAIVGFQGTFFHRADSMTRIVPQWLELKSRFPDVWFGVCGMFADEVRVTMEQNGMPAFDEPTHATRAIAVLSEIAERFERAAPIIDCTQSHQTLPDHAVGEHEALQVLARAGLPTIDTRLAPDADAAVAAAEAIGFPVAMKIASAQIMHKTEVGGVKLGLSDADAVRAAFAEISANAARLAPDATVDGCIVAPMVPGGVEAIIGVNIDPVFGAMVMFGLGGVLVEVMEDVSFRRAPFDIHEAHRMIDEIKCRKVLDGVRGAPRSDIDAVARALADLSRFAAANADQLVSVEANPFLVRAEGEGAIALDAVLITTG